MSTRNVRTHSPFGEAGRLLSQATILLRLQPRSRSNRQTPSPAPAWATGFFFTDTLAMTATHNLALHHSGTVVQAIYKEHFITLEWLRDWSDAAADIAVLRLRKLPATVQINFVPAAYLDPNIPRSERGHFWAGRRVAVYGFALRGESPEERRVDGMIDTELPLIDTYFDLNGARNGDGVDDRGHRTTSALVQRLRVKGNRLTQLRGLSGAAIFDLESHCAIAVQGSYVPDDPSDPDPGDARATEIAWLLERVPNLRRHCVPLQLERGDHCRRSNLPRDLTTFVGREQELAEVRRLLEEHPLVTLAGPGGVGKTRLAIQVARSLESVMPDGVCLVELGSLTDPALVPQAVAATVGVQPEPDRELLTTLVDALRPQRRLLLLDNCEHLVEASARLAEALMRACPQVRVITTSRERLGCAGEAVWRVPSFRIPSAAQTAALSVEALRRFDAVGLFVACATAALPGFALTNSNARFVAEISRRLDGIPLAIELAAALVRGLSVEEIASRLDDRFRLLTSGSRTALPRHQTLRALVDWSYTLLSPAEQRLFNRLSVFAGGFTLPAAEAVGADFRELSFVSAGGPAAAMGTRGRNAGGAMRGDGAVAVDGALLAGESVLDLLVRLVDKSLVLREVGADRLVQRRATRYRLLETLRDYGRQCLDWTVEAEQVRRHHLHYYLDLIEQAAADDDEAQQAWRLQTLEGERENLWTALQWAGDQANAETAAWLACSLSRLVGELGRPAVGRFLITLAFELRRLKMQVYAELECSLLKQTHSTILAAGADLYRIVGDRAAELAVTQELLKAEPDAAARAAVRVRFARLLLLLNDPRRATAELESVAGWANSRRDHPLLLDVALEEGYAHFMTGDCHRGLRAFDAGLVLLKQLRARSRGALADREYRVKRLAALRGRGCVEHNMDANAACLRSHGAALAAARELGDVPGETLALINLADAQWGCHRYGEALHAYQQALTLAEAACYTEGTEFAQIGQGIVLWSIGRHEAAATSLQSGLALARDLSSGWDTAYGLVYLSNVQASLGDLTAALHTNREAVAHAQAAGAGYPLSLATLYLLWKLETLHPEAPEHLPQIEAALRVARTLGLRGLAIWLTWLRLLHRVASALVSDRALGGELERCVRATRAQLPLKGPWEVIGLQVVQALRGHQRTTDSTELETMVGRVFGEKANSLEQDDRMVYVDTHPCAGGEQ